MKASSFVGPAPRATAGTTRATTAATRPSSISGCLIEVLRSCAFVTVIAPSRRRDGELRARDGDLDEVAVLLVLRPEPDDEVDDLRGVVGRDRPGPRPGRVGRVHRLLVGQLDLRA